MPISNYPSGFADGLNVRGLPILNSHAGTVFWLDSNTGSDGNKGTFDRPFATLDYAIGRCTANKGDMIMIKPNHAETITGVSGIDFDIAGISVIGLGTGNQRPRFLMDGADTVTADVAAADITIQNIVFAAGHADIARCLQIQAVGATLIDLEFVENVADENFLIPIDASGTTDNEADMLKVIGCRSLGLDASATEFIAVAADVDGMIVNDNLVIQSGSTDGALIKQATGKDMTNVSVMRNSLQHAMTAGDLLIDNDTAVNTGIVAGNKCKHKDVTGAHSLIDADGVGLFDNLSTSLDTASGFILPAIDADS